LSSLYYDGDAASAGDRRVSAPTTRSNRDDDGDTMTSRHGTAGWTLMIVVGLAICAGTALTATAQESAEPEAARDLTVVDVPTPLSFADATAIGEKLRAADGPVLLRFGAENSPVAPLQAAGELARAILDAPVPTIAALDRQAEGAVLMPIMACRDLWLAPGADLGPFSGGYAEIEPDTWQRVYGAFISRMRTGDAQRAGRVGIWQRWTAGDSGTLVVTTDSAGAATPPRFEIGEPGDGRRLVRAANEPLVLLPRELAQLGGATVTTDPLAHAKSAGFSIVQPQTAPTTAPEPGDSDGGSADPGAAPASGDDYSVPVMSDVRPPLPTSPQAAAIIPVHGTIDDGLGEHIARRSADAVEAGAKVIVFELDTPGGSVASMIDIVQTIADLSVGENPVLTVAWVDVEAISAGAVIALACDYIAMKTGTRMGDAQPIMPGGEGGYSIAGEKIQSYLRAIATRTAARNGYPRALINAMITQQIEVVEIAPRRPGDLYLLEQRFDSPYVERSEFDAWEHRDRFSIVGVIVKGAVEGAAGDGTIADGELLVMNAAQGREWGFALPNVATFNDLTRVLQIGEVHGTGPITRYDITWVVEVVRWIQSLGALFILAGLLGIYLEVKTPGVGFGAVIALVAFGIYFGSNFFIGLAESWEILLFLAGIVFILVEVFVLPGTAVFGVTGLVAIFASLVLAAQDFVIPETEIQTGTMTTNLLSLGIAVVGATVGMVVLAKFLPHLPIARGLFLRRTDDDVQEQEAGNRSIRRDDRLLGQLGETLTELMPTGKARFGTEVVDVQTKGKPVAIGVAVRVVDTQGNRIMVKPEAAAEGEGQPV
jgi:membrane-bound serine protease (ClpP class)